MATTKWVLDPTHSQLGFKIKHLMITSVSGSFRNFKAEVEANETDFSTAQINLTAEMESISTLISPSTPGQKLFSKFLQIITPSFISLMVM